MSSTPKMSIPSTDKTRVFVPFVQYKNEMMSEEMTRFSLLTYSLSK